MFGFIVDAKTGLFIRIDIKTDLYEAIQENSQYLNVPFVLHTVYTPTFPVYILYTNFSKHIVIYNDLFRTKFWLYLVRNIMNKKIWAMHVMFDGIYKIPEFISALDLYKMNLCRQQYWYWYAQINKYNHKLCVQRLAKATNDFVNIIRNL